jgi:hypothetical protein
MTRQTYDALITIAPVDAGDKVTFPAHYATGVMYASHDLSDAKEFREFYDASRSSCRTQ